MKTTQQITQNRPALVALLVALGLGSLTASVGASITNFYSDTFTGTDGTSLHGRTMEVGGKVWTSVYGNLQITNNAVGLVTDDSAGYGRIATIPFVVNSGSLLFSVQAQLNPNNGGFYDEIGFDLGGGEQLFVRLSGYNNYALIQLNPFSLLANTAATTYNTGYNDVKLTYNITNTFVTVEINGVTEYNAAVAGITPFGGTTAWFDTVGQTFEANGNVDNFILTEVVPEPSAVALMAVAASLLMRRKFRRE